MNPTVAILAYGSLIANPGEEIAATTVTTRTGVMTPFKVEFARKSNKRRGAPTLVPVESGGAKVQASLFVLDVPEVEAIDRLYRREINEVGSGERYQSSADPGPNTIVVRRLENFEGIDVVLYTEIAANILNLDAKTLAELAIKSARVSADGRDGISYLIEAKDAGIRTPLSDAYEEEIKRRMQTASLREALRKARMGLSAGGDGMEQESFLLALPTPTHSRYTTLLSDIEKGEIKIPQFQRDFVWSIQKSAALIDSVIKAYPIGTFIFWDTKERLRSVRNLGSIALPDPKEGDVVSFVLDGQQRLTSLFATLKGLKVERLTGKTEDFSEVYVDLNARPDEQIVTTDLTGKDLATCIKLADLLYGGLKKLTAYPDAYHAKLDEYKQRIQSYDFSIVKVRDVPIDVATEIFTRINVGGKPLSLFEIMVAKTYDEKLDFDLSEKFDGLISSLSPLDYETISDATILQLISLILANDCKKQTILKLGKAEFINTWDKAIDGIERAVEYFRGTYRIPVSHLLPYNTLLVPFGYFFYRHPDKPDAVQKPLLEDFFWRCSLGGRYSSAVESKLAQDTKRIDLILEGKPPEYDWPINISPEFLIENGWFNAGRSFVKALLCLYAYHEPKSFNDNATVNIQNNWLKQSNSKNYHHFFPRAYLSKLGVEEARINNVLNITIVDDYLNKRKIRARPPSDYMTEFKAGNGALATTAKTHLIDDLESFGVWSDDYGAFIRKRAEAVSAELAKRVIDRAVDAQGQSVRDDDFEEEMTAFE